MPSRVDQVTELGDRMRELSRSPDVERVREELKRILASGQFRASNRSCAFLKCVVEKAISGSFDTLKERVLGVELFGRDPLFDTDHDSVVRVAANDVRKRLREYYRDRPQGGLRISLPTGIYIPEVEITPEQSASTFTARGHRPEDTHASLRWRRFAPVLLLIASSIAIAACVGIYRRQPAAPDTAVTRLLPWSALLKSGRPINLVLADANLVVTKVRSGHDLPVETYAERHFDYAADLSGPLGAFLNEIPLTTVSDAILASRIAELAAEAGRRVQVRYCNRFDISELKGDEPLVFFGSPMSDPWVALLYDQLNFRIVHRFDSGRDVCINARPHAGEPPIYFPSRKHTGFSEGYALVALEPNLAGTASVLIIAGTSTEATQAAGEFVTNPERLSDSLKKFDIDPRSGLQHLELVIRTAYVSASSTRSEIVAYRAK